jgi:hypothetical protein
LRRRLLNLLTALSLLLSVAAVALWVRSYFCWDSVGSYPYQTGTLVSHGRTIESFRGKLWVTLSQTTAVNAELASSWATRAAECSGHVSVPRDGVNPQMVSVSDELPAFRFKGTTEKWTTGAISVLWLGAPHWLLAGLFAAARCTWAGSRLLRRRRRRLARGLCPRCGYDLRATRDRCPERGATASP